MDLFDRILKSRGITTKQKAAFFSPTYEPYHDPFLLPDMRAAVDRLVVAHKKQEKITIYGDYDIDGLSATTLLLDALDSFGFKNVKAFIPNRFTEGYGLTIDAIQRIADDGAQLIITVDCGSLSHAEIKHAGQLGVDVIVTDHHNVAPEQPEAVAVINPKRLLAEHPEAYENYVLKPSFTDKPNLATKPNQANEKLYPFLDLPGVGVAFKLVQALQTELDGLEKGQEKWLLDLVALGTVCDVVSLVDENRTHVFWGLKVLTKTRRHGLKALMAVAGVRPEAVNARSLGFALGPRMNAAGRLETAQYALDMLTATDDKTALKYARKLDEMNRLRRQEQDQILKQAISQAESLPDQPVLVVASTGWNHGIVGIVAAKLLEKYKKPAFVLAIDEAADLVASDDGSTEAKGSARSYGDFSAADAIRFTDDIITKGGGHKFAAGVTLPAANVELFRARVNEFYKNLKLVNQPELLLPGADAEATLDDLTEELVDLMSQLEPFGNGNPQPVVKSNSLIVTNVRKMGTDAQHLKLDLKDSLGKSIQMLAFNAPPEFFVEPGQTINAWYQLDINEWNGRRAVEGRLLHIEIIN